MDEGKYDYQVTLLCPTCGSDQFLFDDEVEYCPVRCVNCGREMSRDELVQENAESIDTYVAQIGEEVKTDIAKELKKSLRDSFKSSEHIRLKE